jgi:hypothetical protein
MVVYGFYYQYLVLERLWDEFQDREFTYRNALEKGINLTASTCHSMKEAKFLFFNKPRLNRDDRVFHYRINTNALDTLRNKWKAE